MAKNFTIIAHELSHFLFYDYFQNYLKEKGITEDKFQDLKESSTVLLNTEYFKNLLLIEDGGYAPHQKLRELILSSWNKNKNLKKTIDDTRGYR